MSAVCTECGTPADRLGAAPLAWKDWRRWVWPAMAVVWLAALVHWENRVNWWGVRTPPAYPATQMPMATMARHLRTSEHEGARVRDLIRIAQHGGDGTLARSVLTQGAYFYSGHIEDRGQLAVVLDTTGTAMVGTGWAFGWPWPWANRSEMTTYADVATRQPVDTGGATYPPSRVLRPLRGMWTRYPPGGAWISFEYDLTPIVAVLFLAWLAGRVAWFAARRAREHVRRRARWAARLTVIALTAAVSVAKLESVEASYAGATTLPMLTGLTRGDVQAIAAGPDADRTIASAMLAALPRDADPGTYVLACMALKDPWWVTWREWPLELPFVTVSGVHSETPESLPSTGVTHWSWMVWGVWNGGGTSGWSVQVHLDQMVYALGPCWVIWAGGPAAVGLARGWVARRRWRKGLCVACGYPRPTAAATVTPV